MSNVKINIVVNIDFEDVLNFESWLRGNMHEGQVLDFRFLPNTDELKESDPTFRKLLQAKYEAGKRVGEYINNFNPETK